MTRNKTKFNLILLDSELQVRPAEPNLIHPESPSNRVALPQQEDLNEKKILTIYFFGIYLNFEYFDEPAVNLKTPSVAA